jgi:hypothetical protein
VYLFKAIISRFREVVKIKSTTAGAQTIPILILLWQNVAKGARKHYTFKSDPMFPLNVFVVIVINRL